MYLISSFVLLPRKDRKALRRGIVDVTLLNLGRVVQHVRKGRQESNRISIGQDEIHRSTPQRAESPLVLK